MLGEDKYLLGKFQIAAVPVMADYDAAFKRIENRKEAPSECIGPEGFNGRSLISFNNLFSILFNSFLNSFLNSFSGWFWVLHSAAPNIGESSQAEDFLSYSVSEVPD